MKPKIYGNDFKNTAATQLARLKSQLIMCRPHMLDQYTVEGLMRGFSKLKPAQVGELLAEYREKRKGEER